MRTQLLLNAEVTLQFQCGPMVERIADGKRQHLAPLGELVFVRSLTSNIMLINAEGSQRTPFVMITAQPQLSDAAKPLVLGYGPGIKMTVIVNDRQRLGMLMIQDAGFLRLQQKILVN
ncbi:hypothetical protein D3C73_891310 [compost metagenome]